MDNIARELLRVAAEISPRIRATFTKTPKTEDRDLNSAHFDIQRFVATLRKNEELECFVSRMDNDEEMEITVGFTDHDQMKGIVKSMKQMLEKQGKKSGLKVKIDTSPDEK